MGVLINLLLWPLGAVAIYFLQPALFPDEPPPPVWVLALVAAVGMVSCIWSLIVSTTLSKRNPKKPPLSHPDD